MTTATWMRSFVRSHPSYAQDSVVTPLINYDLIQAIDGIERGTLKVPELLPESYLGSGMKEGDKFDECCGDLLGI